MFGRATIRLGIGPHCSLIGFPSPLTMHCNAFAANGIGRKGGDGSAQRGRSVIYDCLVLCGLFDLANRKKQKLP